MSINPIKATEAIGKSYKSYLSTTLGFQDKELQVQFIKKLDQPEKLIRGPILEATPSFKKAATMSELIDEGVLSPRLRNLKCEGLPLERPLYEHQEKAIRKLVQHNRNIIVATGTGSGKTEAFIVPILNYLLKEEEKGTLCPGVRSLLLYPMNALANDQLARLRRYLENHSSITFGRYTGETKETNRQAIEIYREIHDGQEPLKNELISREQMRETPPHILITNYAMLEYLLMRPKDSELFDGEYAKYWRFIVMDEVHTYSGAKGIETAMLIRRLKDRVVRSKPGKLKCIGTSATLSKGREDFNKIIE
jgi:ATP-dependent helicase YprA (DUF1998 family)